MKSSDLLYLLPILFLFQAPLFAAKIELELTPYAINIDPSQNNIEDLIIGEVYIKYRDGDDWTASITGDSAFIRDGSSGENIGDFLDYSITFNRTGGLGSNNFSNIPENTSFSSTPHVITYTRKGRSWFDVLLNSTKKPELLQGSYTLSLTIELAEN